MKRGSGSVGADIAQVKRLGEGCYCRPSDHKAGGVGAASGNGKRSEASATLRPRSHQYLTRLWFSFFFFCFVFLLELASGSESAVWGRWARGQAVQETPSGALPFFHCCRKRKKRKKAQQVRVGFPVKPTDRSAHIRRLGTEISLRPWN